MPKLNKETAKKVGQANSDFEVLPPDTYEARLREVATKEGEKAPYWRWEFEIPEGLPFAGRRLWVNTSLSEKAAFKLNEAFTAFGVAADTDTDELIGQSVLLSVSQAPISGGARMGELGNNVDKMLPLMSDGGGSEEPF